MASVTSEERNIESGIIFGMICDDATIASGAGAVEELTVLAYDAANKKYIPCDPTADPSDPASEPSCLVALGGAVDATSEDKYTRVIIQCEVDESRIVLAAGAADDVRVALREKGIILRKAVDNRV
ncbi:head decoration protein [Photobacterium damselae subsp. damselae]|uniref:head decoration protein n=1 Tax=Photobacterium damselae TaxID=38293 RepID=UPI001F4216BA|nr:head decoration protein [Photobacterium damselae]UKA27186.1 head decoration protein [Photobacterium damselae subsp. damselae]